MNVCGICNMKCMCPVWHMCDMKCRCASRVWGKAGDGGGVCVEVLVELYLEMCGDVGGICVEL